jgi:hypothetical protein
VERPAGGCGGGVPIEAAGGPEETTPLTEVQLTSKGVQQGSRTARNRLRLTFKSSDVRRSSN